MANPPTYTPPSDPEAEQSVLGAILVRPEMLDHLVGTITPGDFYRQAHASVFQAMLDLYAKSEPVDLVTVCALLKERSHLEGVGGPIFLAGLSEQVGFATNAVHYAKIVSEKASLRRLLDVTQEISAACLAPQEHIPEFIDAAEQKVFQVAETNIKQGFSPIGELAYKEVATIEEIYGRGSVVTGVASGFIDIDTLTAGFQKSDLIILASRPSMGKTALALNIAFNAKVPVAFFSLEMSKEQLVRRQLSSIGQIDGNHIRRAFLNGDEWSRLNQAASRLEKTPIFIDDTPGATLLEIRSKTRRLKAQGKCQMIIIDYLQLMRGPKFRSGNREQEISEISRGLKIIAKELDVPVLALAQLSRECEKRPDKTPMLSDLRESGAIEQDADVVMFIYRDVVYTKLQCECPNQAKIIVGKQRNGPIGVAELYFKGEFTRFENLAKEAPY
jgi:replicative DNA helicase